MLGVDVSCPTFIIFKNSKFKTGLIFPITVSNNTIYIQLTNSPANILHKKIQHTTYLFSVL